MAPPHLSGITKESVIIRITFVLEGGTTIHCIRIIAMDTVPGPDEGPLPTITTVQVLTGIAIMDITITSTRA